MKKTGGDYYTEEEAVTIADRLAIRVISLTYDHRHGDGYHANCRTCVEVLEACEEAIVDALGNGAEL